MDFIYLPCPRVGIVNFVSPEQCQRCFQLSQRHGRVVKVQAA